jgi:hypothetical protein
MLMMLIYTASIIRVIASMMEAVRSSETSVYFSETTQRYNLESFYIHTRRRESLESHSLKMSENRMLRRLFGAQREMVKVTYQRHVHEIWILSTPCRL